MKKGLLFIFAVLIFAACSKNNDPAPDIAGTYQMTELTLVDTTITLPFRDPQSNLTIAGAVNVSRQQSNQNQILITYNLGLQGQQNPTDTLGVAEIRNISGNTYDIYDNSSKVGSLDGTNFNLDLIDDSSGQPSRFAIKARK